MMNMRLVRLWLLALFCLLFSACGGGGGGGDSDPTMEVSRDSVTFTTFCNSPLPPTQSVNVKWDSSKAAVLFDFPDGQPAWISATVDGKTLTFGLTTTSLPEGTYTCKARFYLYDFDATLLDTQDVAVRMVLTDKITISSDPTLEVEMIDTGSAPSAQDVNLVGNGIDWSATSNRSWVTISPTSGTTPSVVSIGVDPTGLAVGTHTASVDFEDTDTGDIATVDINFTKEPNILGLGSDEDLTFNMVYGAPAPAQQAIELTGIGKNWTATCPDSWPQLSALSGTTPSNLTLGVDPAGLTAGTYLSSITFEDIDTGDTVTVDLTFVIEPNHLALISDADLSFSMIRGDAAPSVETVSLIGDGVNWTATPSASWIDLSQLSGVAPDSLTLGIDPAGLAPGNYSGTVDFYDSYSDETVTVNVAVEIQAHHLFVHDNGIAMTSTPSVSNLRANLDVLNNKGATIPWTASSNQPWLVVTASGNTGDAIILDADPTGLVNDTIHYATVTIDSSDPSIEGPEYIRVGLWVGSADPNAMDTLTVDYSEIASDPIRPWVYMHSGGTSIDIYNVYTGTLVKTLFSVAAQLGDMEVSTDGSSLYVADLTNFDIVPINLDTDVVGTTLDLTGSGSLFLAYGRTKGQPLLITSKGSVLNPDTWDAYSASFTAGYYSSSKPTISQNGEKVCGVNLGLSPYTIQCYDLDYKKTGTEIVTLQSLGAPSGPGGNAKDLALTHDGSRVYVASGAPYTFVGFDTSTMVQDQTLPAGAYPNAVEIGPNGLLYGGISSSYGPTDLWVYSTDGVEQSSYYLSGYADRIRDRQVAVSGDGARIIVATDDPKVVILDSP